MAKLLSIRFWLLSILLWNPRVVETFAEKSSAVFVDFEY